MDFENIIGWILGTMLIAIPALVIWAGIKLYKRTKLKQEEAWFKNVQADAELKREVSLAQDRAKRLNLAKPTPEKVATARTYATSRTTTSSTSTSTAPAKDWSDDLLTTMIIADMLTNNKDVVAGTVKWDNDVPTITESKPSSWGLDDSDSRSSASSSFGSSDSSSSDSWSSSSDSGPSSDW